VPWIRTAQVVCPQGFLQGGQNALISAANGEGDSGGSGWWRSSPAAVGVGAGAGTARSVIACPCILPQSSRSLPCRFGFVICDDDVAPLAVLLLSRVMRFWLQGWRWWPFPYGAVIDAHLAVAARCCGIIQPHGGTRASITGSYPWRTWASTVRG
jgi:hypothetical protein